MIIDLINMMGSQEFYSLTHAAFIASLLNPKI